MKTRVTTGLALIAAVVGVVVGIYVTFLERFLECIPFTQVPCTHTTLWRFLVLGGFPYPYGLILTWSLLPLLLYFVLGSKFVRSRPLAIGVVGLALAIELLSVGHTHETLKVTCSQLPCHLGALSVDIGRYYLLSVCPALVVILLVLSIPGKDGSFSRPSIGSRLATDASRTDSSMRSRSE
jgi:formate-dependent nitrite reductase membrane component NrfD